MTREYEQLKRNLSRERRVLRGVSAIPLVEPARQAGGRVDDALDRLVRLAGLLTGNQTDAEDLSAEAMARTIDASRRRRVDDEAAYARRVLVNLVAGEGRRSSVRRRHQHRFVSPASSPDATAAVDERLRLWRSLLALPARQRAVLVLRFYEDLSEAATAEAMSLPVGTVKSLTSRGLAQLRTEMEEDVDGG